MIWNAVRDVDLEDHAVLFDGVSFDKWFNAVVFSELVSFIAGRALCTSDGSCYITQKAAEEQANLELVSNIETNAQDIEDLQSKHLYLHRLFFQWYNSGKTKRVQMFITLVSTNGASLAFSGTGANKQTAFRTFREACFVENRPTAVIGSFWGNAFDYNDLYPDKDAGYTITSAKMFANEDGIAGHEYLAITGDPLARTKITECGETVIHIDYNTGGSITVADDITMLF